MLDSVYLQVTIKMQWPPPRDCFILYEIERKKWINNSKAAVTFTVFNVSYWKSSTREEWFITANIN